MKRILPLLVVLFPFVLPLSAASISGTVTPAAAGFAVAAYDASGSLKATAATDSAGRYSLTLPSGSYRVLAYDPSGVYATSFYPDAESFETSAILNLTQSIATINFALVVGGTIAGRVTDEKAQPLAGMVFAVYNLDGTRRAFAKTDSSGRCNLVVPPGAYKIAAYDEAQKYATLFYRFNSNSGPGTISFGSADEIAIKAGDVRPITLELPIAERITGTVTDSVTHAPLPNITVEAYDDDNAVAARATTDSSGRYTLVLAPAVYGLVFSDKAGIYATLFYPNADSIETTPAVRSNTADAAMERAGHVEGVVRDASGHPLPDMTVAVYNLTGTTRTRTKSDANGRYSVALPHGEFALAAYDERLVLAPAVAPMHLFVVSGQTISGIDFTLVVAGHISGFADGGTVAAYDSNGVRIASVNTDAIGHYRLAVPPGTWQVVAFDPTLFLVPASAVITVAAGEERTQNFGLQRGAPVKGLVQDISTGAGIGGITVEGYDATGARTAVATTDPTGHFGMALPYGVYRFVAADPQHRYATAFYENAASFADARPVTLVESPDAFTPVFRMSVAGTPVRRRAVRS